MAITTLGAFRYIGLDTDIPSLPLSIEAGAIFDAYDTNRKFVFNGSGWDEFSGTVPGDTVIFNGQSTDTKPTMDVPFAARFFENDTGRSYFWDGANWDYESQDDESKNFNALKPRSSFVQLFGDTFATKAVSTLYLLENLNDTAPTAGTSLTENGDAFDFTIKAEELPLRGYITPSFNGTNQYLSLPTEPKVEVGFGSFVASIWFKTTKKGSSQFIMSYGDIDGGEQNWYLQISGANEIRVNIDDGTNTIVTTDPTPDRFQDGKWHIASMVVDRTPESDLMSLLVDGELIDSVDISSVTLTLDNVGTDLIIGTVTEAGNPTGLFTGQLANFSLYFPDTTGVLPPDYNIPALLQAGIRENANLGTMEQLNDPAQRLNSKFRTLNSVDGNFLTCVINTSEGIYDYVQGYETNTNRGIQETSIDGIIIDTTDQFSGSVNNVVRKTTSGIYISAGTHIFKIQCNDNNVGSSGFRIGAQFFELIKRDGNDEGDDEATSGILFGDEIDQKRNFDWAVDGVSTIRVYNTVKINNPSSVGDFTEGDFFLKKGLYNFTITQRSTTSSANISLYVGGVKVFDDDATWDSATNDNLSKTVSAFVEGGKTTIRWEVASIGGGSSAEIVAIRFELVSGKSNEDTVNVWGFDDDFQTVSGTPSVIFIETNSRFNGFRFNTTDALNDEVVYSRYFSGGTYKLHYLYRTGASGGITDILLNGDTANPLLDGVDQFAPAATRNNSALTTVTIPRGFQNISVFNQAVGGGGGFQYLFNVIEFTKIATVENAEEDENSDPVHGNQVPLAKYTGAQQENEVVFNLADLDRFRTLTFKISVDTVSGSSDLLLAYGETTAYYSNSKGLVTDVLRTNDNVAEFVLVDGADSISANVEISGEVKIDLTQARKPLGSRTVPALWNFLLGNNVPTQQPLSGGGQRSNPFAPELLTWNVSFDGVKEWKAGANITILGEFN